MDEDWTIDLDESPRPENVQAVQAGLRAYNRSRVPGDGYGEFAVFLRAADRSLLGGLLAEAGRGWLHISALWVEERARGASAALHAQVAGAGWAARGPLRIAVTFPVDRARRFPYSVLSDWANP